MKLRHDYEAELRDRAAVDAEFRAKLIEDPRAAIAELYAVELEEDLELKVIEETDDTVYLVLPRVSGELSPSELEAVAGGVRMAPLVDFKQSDSKSK